MIYNAGCSKWYALFVMTGEEDNVKARLQYRFKEREMKIVVPKRKLRERKNGAWEYRIRNLFPGYVLINGHIGIEEYYTLKGIPGLIKILGDRNGPYEIDEQEINVITGLIYSNEVIGNSSVFADGARIVVTDGPLLGMDGLIESLNRRKGRARVRLNFFGESRLVDLSISFVQPA